TARVEGEILAPACCELLRYSIQVRPTGDPLVGDGVQPWQGQECLHPKRWPACAPRPRTHSAAAMRALPAGWTSSIRTAPCPVVISKASSVCWTAPGAPRPSTTLAPNSLISRPSSSVHAPGLGSTARISRATRSAGSAQRMRAVSRVSLGAYVARACSWGCGSRPLVSDRANASTRACAPISDRCSDSSPPVTSGSMSCGIWRRIGPESSPASICMIVTPVCVRPFTLAHSTGAAPRSSGRSAGWRTCRGAAAALTLVGLRDSRDGVEPLAEQCFERGNGELRRSEKDHAHSELARRLRRHVFHVPGLPLARLLPLGEEQSPFHRAQVVEEEHPIQVVDLVLHRPRLEAGELDLVRAAVAIERLERDAERTL